MRLYIKEKVFSWGDKFQVWDEAGQVVYTVEGEVFTWGKKLHVYDPAGQEVAFIRQELTFLLPRYQVFLNGSGTAQICREFSWFHPRYRVDGMNWEITGDFLAHEYQITRSGSTVARIEKHWMTWGDSYELTIADPADALMALAVVVTIDCIQEQDSNTN